MLHNERLLLLMLICWSRFLNVEHAHETKNYVIKSRIILLGGLWAMLKQPLTTLDIGMLNIKIYTV